MVKAESLVQFSEENPSQVSQNMWDGTINSCDVTQAARKSACICESDWTCLDRRRLAVACEAESVSPPMIQRRAIVPHGSVHYLSTDRFEAYISIPRSRYSGLDFSCSMLPSSQPRDQCPCFASRLLWKLHRCPHGGWTSRLFFKIDHHRSSEAGLGSQLEKRRPYLLFPFSFLGIVWSSSTRTTSTFIVNFSECITLDEAFTTPTPGMKSVHSFF
jgi:hypothetical protein